MKTLLFISPHLDDALLSCGARIWQSTQAGQDVLVASVFTNPSPHSADSHKTSYQKRISDDKQATQLLGARSVHMGFIDAPFRNKQYRDFTSILFHHELPKSDRPVMLAVAKHLRQLIQESNPDEVWFPLGVGGHIDHHIVYESSKLLKDVQAQFHYYEDLPYALLPGWNSVRWHQLKATPEKKSQNLKTQKMSLVETSFSFVHNYMASPQDKLTAMVKYDREWETMHPHMSHTTTWTLDKAPFSLSHTIAPSHFFVKKCEAISCYTTEWPILFGREVNNIWESLGSGIEDDVYKETYWSKIS